MNQLPQCNARNSGARVRSCAGFFLLLFFACSSFAANVRIYFPSNTNATVLLTNTVIAVPTTGNALANGYVVPVGLPVRITFGATGVTTNSLGQGYWALTNSLLGSSGIVIRVPNDSSATLYDYTNLLWSGYNKFVTVDASLDSVAALLTAGTNSLIYTNAGKLVINSTASGGGTGTVNGAIAPLRISSGSVELTNTVLLDLANNLRGTNLNFGGGNLTNVTVRNSIYIGSDYSRLQAMGTAPNQYVYFPVQQGRLALEAVGGLDLVNGTTIYGRGAGLTNLLSPRNYGVADTNQLPVVAAGTGASVAVSYDPLTAQPTYTVSAGSGGSGVIWTVAGSTIYPSGASGSETGWVSTGSTIYPE